MKKLLLLLGFTFINPILSISDTATSSSSVTGTSSPSCTSSESPSSTSTSSSSVTGTSSPSNTGSESASDTATSPSSVTATPTSSTNVTTTELVVTSVNYTNLGIAIGSSLLFIAIIVLIVYLFNRVRNNGKSRKTNKYR
jgi:hypothetical protein